MNNNRLITLILTMMPLLLLFACKNDDTDFGELISETKEKPIEITFPLTPLNEEPDLPPSSSSENYNDYIESFKPSVDINILFSDDDAVIDNPSESVEITKAGAHVKANINSKSVRFILSGNSNNGSFTIEGESRCEIDVDNLQLTNPNGAAINNQCSKTLYFVAKDGTSNSLASKGGNNLGESSKACLFSEGQISFSGSGALQIESSYRNGIASDDYIIVRPLCRINITCDTGNGIKANDGVTINGGTINILASYDGGKGINSEDFVSINGGLTTIINTGASRIEEVGISEEFPDGKDVVSSAGIKCDSNFTLTNGSVNIQCTGDNSKGINTNGDYLQTGGNAAIVTLGKKDLATPKGIKADGDIIISAGDLYSYSLYSMAIDADGSIDIYSYLIQKSYLVVVGR